MLICDMLDLNHQTRRYNILFSQILKEDAPISSADTITASVDPSIDALMNPQSDMQQSPVRKLEKRLQKPSLDVCFSLCVLLTMLVYYSPCACLCL